MTQYCDNIIDYDYIGEEYDVLHDGNRIMDISFLSVYMKQIGNSNVEIQLRGLNKIYEILKKIQNRFNRTYNRDSPYDDNASCGNNNKYYNNYNQYLHKWLSEPRLAEYLTQNYFIQLLFERDSHHKILERSGNIIQFLAEQNKINQKDLQLIWNRCQHKHESQCDAYFKIIKTLALSLDTHSIKFLLDIIIKTPKQEWNKDYVQLIYTITKYAAQKRFKRKNDIKRQSNIDTSKQSPVETYWFGLESLWTISLNESFENSNLQKQAQGFVVELLSYECFESQIPIYLGECVQYLQQHKYIVKALRFFKTISIRHIWSNVYQKTGIQQQHNAELLKNIAKSNNLLQLVFDDLRKDFTINNNNGNNLIQTISTNLQLGAKHKSLQERLVFIDFLLRFADEKVEQEQVKELWEMVVCNPALGEMLQGNGLDFFANVIDPQKQEKHFFDAFVGQNITHQMPRPYNAAFTDDITHYVGNHLCNTLDTKQMTLKHFNLRKAYFYRIGVLDNLFRLSGIHYYLMDANRLNMDWLWDIVFNANVCAVSSAAQLLIKDIYTLIDCDNGNIDISLLYETFVDKCMTHAHNATRPSTPVVNDTDCNGDINMKQSQNVAANMFALLNVNNGQNKDEVNRRTIKRCFSLLRMAIDNFGGKRHGDTINIKLKFVEISKKENKQEQGKGIDELMIQMGELQSCKELAARVGQEICKKCAGKQYNIKGLIKSGKRIDTQDNTTLADEFTFGNKNKCLTVVYTTSDIPQPVRQPEQKTQSISNNGQVPPAMAKKPPLHLETTMVCDDTPDSPNSNETTVATGDVDIDIEAMTNDPKMIEQQKRIETSLRSSVDRIDSHRETNPSPPPPPSVAGNSNNNNNGTTTTTTAYPTTPRPTMPRKQPQFGQNGPKKATDMKQLTLTHMYKNGGNIKKNIKSDYSDCMTGGLTRLDSMVSVDYGKEDGYQRALHPSDILSKSKYFNQLFGFLAYPYDIACEAWEILRKLPLNRDKKLCVKDFNNGWNKMFDLKQHQSVLMARYGLDILSKLMRNDVKMYKTPSVGDNVTHEKNNNNEQTTPRWIVQFIRRHGLVLVFQLLISIEINVNNNNKNNMSIPPEISCASMIIHFLADILKIDNEPVSIANEILNDKETSNLFLSPQVLSSIMKIIGVLSSFTDSVSNNNGNNNKSNSVMTGVARIIGPQLPDYLGNNTPVNSVFGLNNGTDPMKFSTEVLKLCFVVLKFILQNDHSHKLIEYFLNSDLRQWIYRLLIHSPNSMLRLMVKSQLQLLYHDHFEMGQKLFNKNNYKVYNLDALDKLNNYSQNPRLVVGIVRACLEILGILQVDNTDRNGNLSLQYADRFHCNEFMEFLHDCIRDLVCSFDVLCQYPKYKSLLIEDCNNYNGIDWYDILNKFMLYFISYKVTESKLQSPDDTKLLPIKVNVYSTYFRVNTDDNKDELYADKCLIGTMKIISTLIGTLSHGINKHKLLNNNNKLIELVNNIFERGLFPNIETIWKQRRDIYQLPLCKQKTTRDTAMNLLVQIATHTSARQHIQQLMISHHMNDRKFLNDDWNYIHNILSRSFNGNVGLVNLGATCYMNSLMQQLFANPQFRFSILSRNVKQIYNQQQNKKQELILKKKKELRLLKQQQAIQNGQEYKEEKDSLLEEYKDEDIWKMIIENNSNQQIGDKDDEHCNMLNELQNIFTYLQESDLRSYDPQSFCYAYKQPGGRPMELRVQMDVDEFFNIFTDKLEKQLQYDSQYNIIQYLFGGVFATQMIGRKECKHYREKSDPFVTLTLDVKGKQDIKNSLNSYVQGEIISDYQCDKCNKRIEILKRSCIRILPRNLVIHLKRFDFDIETLGRTKVNDSLQFPVYLDMSAFTKDGLETKEQKVYKVEENDLTEDEKKDRDMNEKKYNDTYDFTSSTMYRLVGVINHSGGTESGHYTSYIREHNDSGANNNGIHSEQDHKWSYANDRIVEPWDYNKMTDDCFGGPLPYIHATTTTVTNNTNNNNGNNGNNNGNGGTTTTTTYTQPSNKMYSAYMLFYERVTKEENKFINAGVQSGQLSKSYYDLSNVLKNNSVTPREGNNKNQNQKLSGHKRQNRCYDGQCDKSIEALEPPHKKQKISHNNNNIEKGEESRENVGNKGESVSISREYLINSDCKQLPKYLSKEQQSMILDCDKKEKVWNENKSAMIERQVLEKWYIETCIRTVLLSVPGKDYKPGDMDENELMNASKLACTLLFETIGHCKNLNQILSRNRRNEMCKILAASPMGCKWFLKKLLAVKENHWLRVLFDPKYNHIYGDTMGDIVRDFVITALKCVRKEEYKYYKHVLRMIEMAEQKENKENNNDEDNDIGMTELKDDTNINISNHLIVQLIKLIISQFPCMDKPDYSHPIFEILMHFAHFGNEERILLINLGMIWKGIAYYRRDFNGLQSGIPTKNSDKHSNNNSSSSSDKIGWKKKTLKETQCFKSLPQIISTLITCIHPERLESFFHSQHYSDNKKSDKAIAEDWLHSQCLTVDPITQSQDASSLNSNSVSMSISADASTNSISSTTAAAGSVGSVSSVSCRSLAVYKPPTECMPNLPPEIPAPLPKPNSAQSSSCPPPAIPKLEKIDLKKPIGPFPNNDYRKFAIAPFVQQECNLTFNDYNWLRNKEVLEYLLEYGTTSHLNEVMISHLAHSSNILYKRISGKITDSFQTAFTYTLAHLFDCIKLILGIMDTKNNKFKITTLPDDELRQRCICRVLPKLFTCATIQEAKYHKDAEALMQFAHELITSTEYSFAFDIACQEVLLENIIKNMFDKNKKKVREISMEIMEYIININHKNNDIKQIEKIIDLVLEKLNIASTLASNQSLIDNSNESFPDDLKNYVERTPKLNRYFTIVSKLMELYPSKIIPKLIEQENCNILCEIVAQLESGADTHQWAKNDDKVIVMKILIDLIDVYNIDSNKLFNMRLIEALTSQYLVSTRSKIVSPHMAQVVSITYRLLTHFACDSNENNENEEDKKDENNDINNGNWIGEKIVEQHWFLWAISDIITPHNVYQSSLAADSILAFLKKIINYKCMENARYKIIKKCMKKWSECESYSNGNNNKKLHQYPRETVLKLLMIVLKDEKDHSQFIEGDGKKLLGVWLKNFFFTEFLTEKEEISTYNIAFDFLEFHIMAIRQYQTLQNDNIIPYIRQYFEAICSIFAYCSNKKYKNEWENIFKKALSVLQKIFDLEKVFPKENNCMLAYYFKYVSQGEILPFSSNIRDYISKNNTDDEEMVIKYLANVIEIGKTPTNYENINKLLKTKCYVEQNKQLLCDKITPLLQIFLNNYGNTNKFKYDNNSNNTNNVIDKKGDFIASIMISIWFLKLIGCTFIDIIEKYLNSYMTYICDKEIELKNNVCGWIIYCTLISCDSLNNNIFLDDINMKLMITLTKCVLNSLLEEQDNESKMPKCRLVNTLKNKTLVKYLPCRLDMVVNEMNNILAAPILSQENKNRNNNNIEMKDESDKEVKECNNGNSNHNIINKTESDKYKSIELRCYGYIKYYYNVIVEHDIVISINIIDKKDLKFIQTNNNINWWNNLQNKMIKSIEMLNNNKENNNEKIKCELIKYLTKINETIENKINECKQSMKQMIDEHQQKIKEKQQQQQQKDIVMNDKSVVKVQKSKVVNKKQRKTLPIKLLDKNKSSVSKEIAKKTNDKLSVPKSQSQQPEPMQIESQSQSQPQENKEHETEPQSESQTMVIDENKNEI